MKRIQVNFRLKSQNELNKIDKLANSAGLTRSEYIRRSVLKEKISPIHADKKAIRECRVELSRHGNNLNQIARSLNAFGIAPDSVLQINALLDEIAKTSKMLFEISKRTVDK